MSTTVDEFLKDSSGRLVPIDLVKPIDLTRNELVSSTVKSALKLQHSMREFKRCIMDEIQAFVELSANEYDVTIGGTKGNITLTSYDGRYRVVRSVADYITFDERLQVAKDLIDNCIKRWSEGARAEIRVLVQDAFQTDKQGKINTQRVLGLKRFDIADNEWQQAMQAIMDSIQVSGSKTYVRIYERIGDSDQYQPISLDIAAL